MVNGIKTSAAAMQAQGDRLAVLANNLANAAAAGFKADHVEFFQSLSSPRAAGSVLMPGPAAPLPPPSSRTVTDFTTGALRETGNPLDLALDGPGFFVLGAASGPRLTRTGTFTRRADGLLAAPDGTPVLDQRRQPIRLPERGPIDVDEGGRISVGGTPVGQLLLVDPPAPGRLTKEGGTRFAPPPEIELAPAPAVKVRQGVIEQSNVNPVLTLVEMIDALRVYEAAQRAARSLDETLGRAVTDVGRP